MLWYYHECLPTLSDYFPAPNIKSALEAVEQKVDNMTKLICENSKIVKSYAQIVSESQDTELEVNMIAERLEVHAIREADGGEKSLRKCSAILHKIPESGNTQNTVIDLLSNAGFNHNTIEEITRLGKLPSTSDTAKPWPVKVKFESEIMKTDFF